MKPIINLDELELESDKSDDGEYEQRYGVISDRIGAKQLGYNLTIVPPGGKACAFHNHHGIEEMFFILEGTGTLRFGEETYPLRKNDVIACPPGKRDVAHQILNTGETELSYLALSTKSHVDVGEFPDADEVKVMVGDYGNVALRGTFAMRDGKQLNRG